MYNNDNFIHSIIKQTLMKGEISGILILKLSIDIEEVDQLNYLVVLDY